MNFTQGLGSPNLFSDKGEMLSHFVHGDDFASSGPADALDTYEPRTLVQILVEIPVRVIVKSC